MQTITVQITPLPTGSKEDLSIQLFKPEAISPTRLSEGAVGFDLFATTDTVIQGRKVQNVPTG